ncbi:hypothetical protein CDD83_1072 [Cordyceps sp. RAO-2017]|nr:hypothetical protein CDD83_1072 [Cordyceps sp. RAO-2017]
MHPTASYAPPPMTRPSRALLHPLSPLFYQAILCRHQRPHSPPLHPPPPPPPPRSSPPSQLSSSSTDAEPTGSTTTTSSDAPLRLASVAQPSLIIFLGRASYFHSVACAYPLPRSLCLLFLGLLHLVSRLPSLRLHPPSPGPPLPVLLARSPQSRLARGRLRRPPPKRRDKPIKDEPAAALVLCLTHTLSSSPLRNLPSATPAAGQQGLSLGLLTQSQPSSIRRSPCPRGGVCALACVPASGLAVARRIALVHASREGLASLSVSIGYQHLAPPSDDAIVPISPLLCRFANGRGRRQSTIEAPFNEPWPTLLTHRRASPSRPDNYFWAPPPSEQATALYPEPAGPCSAPIAAAARHRAKPRALSNLFPLFFLRLPRP